MNPVSVGPHLIDHRPLTALSACPLQAANWCENKGITLVLGPSSAHRQPLPLTTAERLDKRRDGSLWRSRAQSPRGSRRQERRPADNHTDAAPVLVVDHFEKEKALAVGACAILLDVVVWPQSRSKQLVSGRKLRHTEILAQLAQALTSTSKTKRYQVQRPLTHPAFSVLSRSSPSEQGSTFRIWSALGERPTHPLLLFLIKRLFTLLDLLLLRSFIISFLLSPPELYGGGLMSGHF